jgi:phage gp29-like protein
VGPAPLPNPGVLAREYLGDRIPASEAYRTHYGKALDLSRIDYAIRSANQGQMRALTDLARETVSLDGHLSALLQKRLNRLAALDWDVQPAAGDRIDADKAEIYAGFVRAQLEALPRFRDIIVDLDWAVFDGRAASEIEWRHWGGEWRVMDLHWIHPRRLSFGPDRDLRVIDGVHEGGGFQDVGFPLERVPYKFVVYKPRLFGDYQEREGLAPRSLYWSFFQRFGTRERMALLELFGRPWRILEIDPAATAVNIDSVRAAYESVKNLGYHNTAQLPLGVKLNVVQPFTGAGQVSTEAIDHATKVLSKLFLGSTGTTDAVSTGLGSSIGDAHLSEEDLVIWSDARRLGEAIEDHLTDAIIAVNFGPGELDHAPRFIFRTEPPMNREAEANRLKAALEIGLPVSLEEAREKLGIQELREGEPYLRRVQRVAELGQIAPPPANEVVYPVGEAPDPGEIIDTPLVANNLPSGGAGPSMPPALPQAPAPALPTPAELSADEDDPDDVAALAEKMTSLGLTQCEHGRKNRCDWCGVERHRDVEMVDGTPQWVVAWKPIRKRTAPAA